ncbi:hypothetical protein Rhopal_007803-T1 [Rhodotorula paludigena]|uniref:Ubiquitin-like domain-containing protein n=1 Tax=Rhodotorula paludigena TaxID=86838 RepID=A0AAV5GYU4_9BASI|nr:hypothetical protein Rhopal_007803-T1 [Rhodotorula paludigena]
MSNKVSTPSSSKSPSASVKRRIILLYGETKLLLGISNSYDCAMQTIGSIVDAHEGDNVYLEREVGTHGWIRLDQSAWNYELKDMLKEVLTYRVKIEPGVQMDANASSKKRKLDNTPSDLLSDSTKEFERAVQLDFALPDRSKHVTLRVLLPSDYKAALDKVEKLVHHDVRGRGSLYLERTEGDSFNSVQTRMEPSTWPSALLQANCDMRFRVVFVRMWSFIRAAHTVCPLEIEGTTVQPSMRVFVKTPTGRTTEYLVDRNTHVAQLAKCIEAKEGICADNQRLIYAGRHLEFNRMLSDYQVGPDAVLHLVFSLRGGKPVIYLRPPAFLASAQVSLTLSPEWEFSALYPLVEVDEDKRSGESTVAWTVSAERDGALVDLASGLELKYLFWEAETTHNIAHNIAHNLMDDANQSVFHPSSPSLDRSNGCVLPFSSFLAHLDKTLALLSLDTSQRNDFLTYWMAHFTRICNAGQLVAFRFVAQREYERAAQLTVEPAPDVVTRVFLLFRGIDDGDASAGWRSIDEVDWVEEVGVEVDKVRDESLFRVLEWGGMKVA